MWKYRVGWFKIFNISEFIRLSVWLTDFIPQYTSDTLGCFKVQEYRIGFNRVVQFIGKYPFRYGVPNLTFLCELDYCWSCWQILSLNALQLLGWFKNRVQQGGSIYCKISFSIWCPKFPKHFCVNQTIRQINRFYPSIHSKLLGWFKLVESQNRVVQNILFYMVSQI